MLIGGGRKLFFGCRVLCERYGKFNYEKNAGFYFDGNGSGDDDYVDVDSVGSIFDESLGSIE